MKKYFLIIVFIFLICWFSSCSISSLQNIVEKPTSYSPPHRYTAETNIQADASLQFIRDKSISEFRMIESWENEYTENSTTIAYVPENKNFRVSPKFCKNELHLFFTLEQKTFVELQIYDAYSKYLKTLLYATLNAGNYSTIWLPDEQLTNGVYYCRLVINSGDYLEKFVLQKD